MKLSYKLLIACIFLLSNGAIAQTYSYTQGTTSNSIPFRSATSNRCQFLFTPSNFGSPAAGSITKIYIMSGLAISTAGTLSDLTISIGNTSLIEMVSGNFNTGLTLVYSAASTPLPVTASGGWIEITLQTPFYYSGTSNIIVDMSSTAYTGSGLNIRYKNGTNGTRLYGAIATTTATAGAAIMNFGFDYGAATPPCVTTPTLPLDGGVGCINTGNTTLSWPAVTGATGYDVYLNTGTTATTLVSTNQASTTYNAAVTAGPYAWKVVPSNTIGAATGCSTFTFTATPSVPSSVSIVASPTGPICAGTPVTYTATSTNGGTTPAYQWMKRTNNVGTNSNMYTDNMLITDDTISVVMTSSAVCASPASATSNILIPTVLASPTASITPLGNISICGGSSISLNSNTGTGFTYQWQLNNSNIAGATNATYSVATAGNYRVIVSNGICTDTSANKTVSIVLPPVSVITTTATSFCQGASATLTGPAPVTGVSYQWQLNGANIAGATINTYVANAAGSYRLVLSNGNCSDTSSVITLTVNPLPAAVATAATATSFCTGGSVVLNANTGTGLTYQWKQNTVNIAGATSASYTASTAGSYTVTVSNGNCSTTSNAITVVVNTLASPTVTSVGSPSFCSGDSVMLQSSIGTGYTYQWLMNNANVAGATMSSLTTSVAGSYTVMVNNGICSATSTAIVVSENPAPLAVISTTGALSFCEGDTVLITANTGTGFTYQWTLNSTAIAGATSDNYTATATGSYAVEVFDGTCSATSNVLTVTTNPLPMPVITVVGSTMSTGTFATYQWNLNGTAIAGATSQSYTATENGSYSVTVTDATSCAATSAVQVITTVSLDDLTGAANAIKLYPNPVDNVLNIEADRAVNISISSLDGKQLLMAKNAKSIDLSSLVQGLYLVRVLDASTGILIRVDKVNKK